MNQDEILRHEQKMKELRLENENLRIRQKLEEIKKAPENIKSRETYNGTIKLVDVIQQALQKGGKREEIIETVYGECKGKKNTRGNYIDKHNISTLLSNVLFDIKHKPERAPEKWNYWEIDKQKEIEGILQIVPRKKHK